MNDLTLFILLGLLALAFLASLAARDRSSSRAIDSIEAEIKKMKFKEAKP